MGLSALSASLLALFLASVPHLAFQPLNLAKCLSSLSPSCLDHPPHSLPLALMDEFPRLLPASVSEHFLSKVHGCLSITGVNLFLHTLVTIHDCLFSSQTVSPTVSSMKTMSAWLCTVFGAQISGWYLLGMDEDCMDK